MKLFNRCTHANQETITNLHGDLINQYSTRRKTIRSIRRCTQCGKILYSEYLDPHCFITNFEENTQDKPIKDMASQFLATTLEQYETYIEEFTKIIDALLVNVTPHGVKGGKYLYTIEAPINISSHEELNKYYNLKKNFAEVYQSLHVSKTAQREIDEILEKLPNLSFQRLKDFVNNKPTMDEEITTLLYPICEEQNTYIKYLEDTLEILTTLFKDLGGIIEETPMESINSEYFLDHTTPKYVYATKTRVRLNEQFYHPISTSKLLELRNLSKEYKNHVSPNKTITTLLTLLHKYAPRLSIAETITLLNNIKHNNNPDNDILTTKSKLIHLLKQYFKTISPKDHILLFNLLNSITENHNKSFLIEDDSSTIDEKGVPHIDVPKRMKIQEENAKLSRMKEGELQELTDQVAEKLSEYIRTKGETK